ncbi:MAG: NADH-quinone oxidoreductase subunit NuoE [Oscillospiraceae bacterium]|jgi:NADH-quinone oxidoreductase subunit E|nr:NADH-quinone oxidoreductase subunit NuoE [Oscillospiraceae bacterium]
MHAPITDSVEADFSELSAVIASYRDIRGSLITILQKTQELYGWISQDAIDFIASGTGIAPAKIYGVATFYTQFRLKPIGKYLIMLCKGTACHVNSSDEIRATISSYLGIQDGGTSPDGLFTLNTVSCLGCCSLAPVMMIQTPEGEETYGSLTRESVLRILYDIAQKEHISDVGGAAQ